MLEELQFSERSFDGRIALRTNGPNPSIASARRIQTYERANLDATMLLVEPNASTQEATAMR